MTGAARRTFLHGRRKGSPQFSDGEILLVPQNLYAVPYSVDFCDVFVYDIVLASSQEKAGEIALRVGEGDGLFYLGHIGYHIDPPYRGHSYAARACRLALPVFAAYGYRSLVITTDPDNIPSIRTCEKLGCEFETSVPVPAWCRTAYEISARKNRYILQFSGEPFSID